MIDELSFLVELTILVILSYETWLVSKEVEVWGRIERLLRTHIAGMEELKVLVSENVGRRR